MSYGSSSYGSAAIGGSTGTQQQVFFPWPISGRSPGNYEAVAEISTADQFYSVFVRQASEVASGIPFMETEVLTSNDEHETPQLQVTLGDGLEIQAVIGAARFITVRVTVINAQLFQITGRPGD